MINGGHIPGMVNGWHIPGLTPEESDEGEIPGLIGVYKGFERLFSPLFTVIHRYSCIKPALNPP